MKPSTSPLHDLKVIELGSLIAGPFAARILAEFGAEVIKIESPDGGDPLRKWRKLYQGTSLWWYVQSRNKKSLTVNLKHPAGRQIVEKLVAGADVLIENFRPGVLEKLGLGWDKLSAINPGLVMLRLSGFGQTGPLAQQPGFGAIGESMGGLRYVTGFPDRPPVKTGISIGDSIAALWGVIGTLIALRHKERSGQGQMVDVALYEAVFAMMESLVPEFDVFGFIRERTGNIMPGITPSSTHTTRDGKHVAIGANGDAIFKRLMLAIGRDDLANDEQLADNAGRDLRRDEIYAAINAWTSTQQESELVRVLAAAEVPASRVYSVADIFADPHYLARQMLESATLPDGKPFKIPGIVPKLSLTPGQTEWLGPELGAHTDEILRNLAYSVQEITALRDAGAI
ncbi:MAG TPA: CaiB/BaiF CoA-transferase family protein [Accumulibacter sp.]|nr:CaiB/BaiF CoA-transferase family protein [Accumulibacter sp.]HMW17347.1 CaiB/BaiF CoA-transferase family protein [Accumulibacter sp.]HMX21965.1 CaiB/BaiF CoA-transferase family protein [Accumulibacter sp.]HMY05975.1 CaiB/BaiF CoA-transferase family protein [Accumulibacter sp.]HNC17148.1 CaiB/BaiF CoA-transferase family protein [Accumulibacter sp.]